MLAAAHIACMTKSLQHKNQVGQSSENGDHFAAKTFDFAAEVDLTAESTVDTRADTLAAITLACKESGYAGAMPRVYEVLLDRSEGENPMAGALNELTADEVDAAYDTFIDTAATGAGDWIRTYPNSVACKGSLTAAMDHIREVSEAAGPGGVVPGVFEAALERDQEDDAFLDRAYGLTEIDITNIYDQVVAPAIDDLEQDILDNHCTECGASTDDGEGSDGKCGNCADRAATCTVCGDYNEEEDASICADCAEEYIA